MRGTRSAEGQRRTRTRLGWLAIVGIAALFVVAIPLPNAHASTYAPPFYAGLVESTYSGNNTVIGTVKAVLVTPEDYYNYLGFAFNVTLSSVAYASGQGIVAAERVAVGFDIDSNGAFYPVWEATSITSTHCNDGGVSTTNNHGIGNVQLARDQHYTVELTQSTNATPWTTFTIVDSTGTTVWTEVNQTGTPAGYAVNGLQWDGARIKCPAGAYSALYETTMSEEVSATGPYVSAPHYNFWGYGFFQGGVGFDTSAWNQYSTSNAPWAITSQSAYSATSGYYVTGEISNQKYYAHYGNKPSNPAYPPPSGVDVLNMVRGAQGQENGYLMRAYGTDTVWISSLYNYGSIGALSSDSIINNGCGVSQSTGYSMGTGATSCAFTLSVSTSQSVGTFWIVLNAADTTTGSPYSEVVMEVVVT